MFLILTVIVVDKQGVIRYLEIVSDVSNEPDFESALAMVKELI